MHHPTTHDAIALLRKTAVQRFQKLKTEIGSCRAAQAVGKSRSTMWRWSLAFAVQGLEGLIPKFRNSGRPSVVAGIKFKASSVREMERLLLETGSMQRAWRRFKRSSHYPPALARLRLKSVPAPLARLVKLTPLQQGFKVYVSADGKRLFVKVKGWEP